MATFIDRQRLFTQVCPLFPFNYLKYFPLTRTFFTAPPSRRILALPVSDACESGLPLSSIEAVNTSGDDGIENDYPCQEMLRVIGCEYHLLSIHQIIKMHSIAFPSLKMHISFDQRRVGFHAQPNGAWLCTRKGERAYCRLAERYCRHRTIDTV